MYWNRKETPVSMLYATFPRSIDECRVNNKTHKMVFFDSQMHGPMQLQELFRKFWNIIRYIFIAVASERFEQPSY